MSIKEQTPVPRFRRTSTVQMPHSKPLFVSRKRRTTRLPNVTTVNYGQLTRSAARESIMVEAPVAEVYQHWLRGENFPKFMTAIKKSSRLDDTHFAVSENVDGEKHDSVLEFVLRIPHRRLAWRSLSGQLAAGVVTLTPRENGNTSVTLTIMSTYGGAVSQRVANYLQNFKKLVENNGTGEVSSTSLDSLQNGRASRPARALQRHLG